MGQVYKSIVVNAPVEKVWAKLRNFHDMSWAEGVVENLKVVGNRKGDQVGAQRLLNSVFSETLVALDDREHQFSYSIEDGPGTPVAKSSVSDYVSTVKAHPITEGNQTFLEWHSNWNGNDSATAEFCGGIYGAFVGSMKKSFE